MENISDNLEDFCHNIRNFVFERSKAIIAIMLNVNKDSLQEVEEYISFNETILIVKDAIEIKNNFDFNNISQNIVIEICNDLNKRMFNNLFQKLASEGLLECAWSDADDSFIFKLSQKGRDKGISIPPRIFMS